MTSGRQELRQQDGFMFTERSQRCQGKVWALEIGRETRKGRVDTEKKIRPRGCPGMRAALNQAE